MTPPSFAIAMILCGTVSPHLNYHKLLSASFQRATTPLLGRRLVLHDHYQWCHGDTCDTLIYQQKGPLFETGSKTRRFPPASSIYTWTIDTWACPPSSSKPTGPGSTAQSPRCPVGLWIYPGLTKSTIFSKLELWEVEENTWNYVIRYEFLRVFYGVFYRFLRVRNCFTVFFCGSKPGFWHMNWISIFFAKFVIWPKLNGIVGSFEKSLHSRLALKPVAQSSSN